MLLLETLTIKLGTALAKAVAKLWLGDHELVEGATGGLIEALGKRFEDFETREAAERLLRDLRLPVAKRLEAAIAAEFRGTAAYDVEAGVLAVVEVFQRLELSESMVRADLDSSQLLVATRPIAQPIFGQLGGPAEQVAELVLRETCAYVVTLAGRLPNFQVSATRELLKRTSELLDDLGRVLDVVGKLRSESMGAGTQADRDFDTDYRRALVEKLDRLELFGVRTVAGGARAWALSVAYVPLTSRRGGAHQSADVNDCLAGQSRLLIRGEAGSGKTTLLHWLAVRAAGRDFPELLAGWNALVPFYVRLRDCSVTKKSLPRPEQLLDSAAPNLAGAMPAGWAHQALTSGALVLLDGIDEFPAVRRGELDRWIKSLSEDFPKCVFVVTSRPAAVDSDHGRGSIAERLGDLRFVALTLEPMTLRHSEALVRQWHEAVGRDHPGDEERLKLQRYALALRRVLRDRPAVRSLAANPLLCAMICALNWDRRQQLPDDRMELYRLALEMLIDARDAERGIDIGGVAPLNRAAKEELLDVLAYWMLRNGYREASLDEVISQITGPLQRLASGPKNPSEVVQELLERSGVLRQPSLGTVDFIHRTFLEYLAARAAVNSQDLGMLVDKAREESWRETIVFAAGHAKGSVRDKLVENLLKRPWFTNRSVEADVTAACCLETVRASLRPDLLQRLRECATGLFPPRDMVAAAHLAPAAALEPELLKGHAGTDVAAACIRCAAMVGGPKMLEVIESYATMDTDEIRGELLAAWTAFGDDEYLQRVIRRTRLAVSEVDGKVDADTYRCLQVLASTGDPAGAPHKLSGTLKMFYDDRHLSLDRLSVAAAKLVVQISSLMSLECEHPEAGATAALAPLPQLRVLMCGFEPDVDAQVAAVAALPVLESLRLSGATESRRIDLRRLGDCATLRNLEVSGVGLSNTLLLPLAGDLRRLSINHAPGDWLSELNAPNLEFLRIQLTSLPTSGLRLSQLAKLKTLQLRVFTPVNPSSPQETALWLPAALKELWLIGTQAANINNASALVELLDVYLFGVDRLRNARAVLGLPNLRRVFHLHTRATRMMTELEAAAARGVEVGRLTDDVYRSEWDNPWGRGWRRSGDETL